MMLVCQVLSLYGMQMRLFLYHAEARTNSAHPWESLILFRKSCDVTDYGFKASMSRDLTFFFVF